MRVKIHEAASPIKIKGLGSCTQTSTEDKDSRNAFADKDKKQDGDPQSGFPDQGTSFADKDKYKTTTTTKIKTYIKNGINLFCKDVDGYSIGDIDDLLTGDTEQFEDKFLILDDMGNKLKKRDNTILHNWYN